MPDVSFLTAEIDRLTRAVGFWNTVIIVMMVCVAAAATGLVIAQQKAFKRADALASATGQLSELKEQVAEQKIADAKQEAADATGVAEQEKLERLKLEAKIAPRRLTAEQKGKITDNSAAFSELFKGKRIRVVSYSLDTEAFVFSEQIVSALRRSGALIDDDSMSITPTGTVIFGINVFGRDADLAKKLAYAIGSSGSPIAVSFVDGDPTAGAIRIESGAPTPEVTILIGLKPPDKDTIGELKKIMKGK